MHASRAKDECENAKLHECVCTDCLGTLHKWRGLVQLVVDLQARSVWRDRHLREWNERLQRDSAQTETIKQRARVAEYGATKKIRDRLAAAERKRDRSRYSGVNITTCSDRLMVSIVEWLAVFGKSDIAYKATCRILEEGVARAGENLVAYGKSQSSHKHKVRIAESHLWCSLLSIPLDRAKGNSQSAPIFDTATVETLIMTRTTEDDREPIKAAVSFIIDICTTVLATMNLRERERVFRIAASFICPDPEHHGKVRDECLIPLVPSASSGLITDHELTFALDTIRHAKLLPY